MLAIKLAVRNLIGAGLRTWLNVTVLSLAYVLIIWAQGLYLGIYDHTEKTFLKERIGAGNYWHPAYDDFDPLTINESHSKIPQVFAPLITQNLATPILISQASIYPKGRIQTIQMKGIDPKQNVVAIPGQALDRTDLDFPVMIGKTMAKSSGLEVGDTVTVRWRDINGTFDAADATVVKIMNVESAQLDSGQIWIPLKLMQEMLQMPDEATLIIMDKNWQYEPLATNWSWKDPEFFLKEVRMFVIQKSVGMSFVYILLLFLAGLAIFDTQVLAIFKRRKEIGTLIALGLTRAKVISLFTIEGAFHGILAAIISAIWGGPLIYFTAHQGIPVPFEKQDVAGAIAFGERMYPTYGLALVLCTVLIVMLTVTIVSYLPTRQIAKLNPTDALRGKIS